VTGGDIKLIPLPEILMFALGAELLQAYQIIDSQQCGLASHIFRIEVADYRVPNGWRIGADSMRQRLPLFQ
jgi:hypothetical protein